LSWGIYYQTKGVINTYLNIKYLNMTILKGNIGHTLRHSQPYISVQSVIIY